MAAIDISSTSATLNDGILQLENGVALDTTLRNVTDQNNAFYNSLNQQKVGWIMAYLCDSGKVIYIDPPVGITTSANFIIPEQNNELQRYEVTFSWREKNIPTQFAAPAGIFG
jgi:hypothetical protein